MSGPGFELGELADKAEISADEAAALAVGLVEWLRRVAPREATRVLAELLEPWESERGGISVPLTREVGPKGARVAVATCDRISADALIRARAAGDDFDRVLVCASTGLSASDVGGMDAGDFLELESVIKLRILTRRPPPRR